MLFSKKWQAMVGEQSAECHRGGKSRRVQGRHRREACHRAQSRLQLQAASLLLCRLFHLEMLLFQCCTMLRTRGSSAQPHLHPSQQATNIPSLSYCAAAATQLATLTRALTRFLIVAQAAHSGTSPR